jgi:hypothetical protein
MEVFFGERALRESCNLQEGLFVVNLRHALG